ncbi:MAG TPA: ATP-binding cassette domain-containing protein [bacterium]|nr:ATP-binding cassette domain-containing protein [bacterium]
MTRPQPSTARPAGAPAVADGRRATGTTIEPAIRAAELTRRFRDLVAVDAVSIDVHAGEIFGLLGPNGAGKSTMIKMLTTLLPPTSGRAWVAGFDIASEPTVVRRHIGYVPQALSADGALTGYENLLVSSKLYGLARAERARRIVEALELVGLSDAADQLVRQYSGGMIRRLEIAQAMLHRPTVLFMDEPTVGLDPVARRAVWEHVQRLRDMFGTTILITTHYMDEADDLADRVAVMHQGRVAAVGAPDELKAAVGAQATLDDVFMQFTGASIETGGSYRDVLRTRRTARRLS